MADEQNVDIESIKEKIRNLLNRNVQNGASPAEAETCMRKANELMTKYLIDAWDLKTKEGNCESRTTVMHRKNQILKIMLSKLCRTFDVKCFDSNRMGLVMFGFPVDLDIVEYFRKMLIDTMEFEIAQYRRSKEYKYETKERGLNGNVVINDFILGFCGRVCETLEQLYQERNKQFEQATGTSLMVVRADVVQRELDDLYGKMSRHKVAIRGGISGSQADGEDAGAKVRFNHGVSVSEPVAAISG